MCRSSSGQAKAVSGEELEIRTFQDADGPRVRDPFIEVNRLLSPPDLRDVFEAYIERALAEEIDRIEAYYAEHGGGFWVASLSGGVVGMFGLERASADAMELRRMYVDPATRRAGIGRQMLQRGEDECRRVQTTRTQHRRNPKRGNRALSARGLPTCPRRVGKARQQ
jgi:GNAT superfamily N-acetyltransferase